MNKDEILSKIRAEGRDEMEHAVNNRAFYWGTIVLTITCIFFAGTKVLNNGEPFFEFPAILFAYLGGMYAYNYLKMKNHKYLIAAFAFTFAFVCMTIAYFANR